MHQNFNGIFLLPGGITILTCVLAKDFEYAHALARKALIVLFNFLLIRDFSSSHEIAKSSFVRCHGVECIPIPEGTLEGALDTLGLPPFIL
jgi:hypothetical protein